ncbi:MAG TPA: AAA family ATPase [Acidimicrobiales bacterium]
MGAVELPRGTGDHVTGITPIFGRGGELASLNHLLDQVRNGRSAALVVRGEPGIGKTALLARLVENASDFRILRAVGVESEMELPFAGLHELCGSMLGRLELLPGPQREALSVAFGLSWGPSPDRFLVALGALSLLSDASEGKPLLCVVDDAHWLDQASAQVLGFVGRRLVAEPIVIVFAAGTPFPRPDHLAGLPELFIPGLDAEAAHALLTTVTSVTLDDKVETRIIEETHGNPLALIELCRGLSEAELRGGFALPHSVDLPQRIQEQYLGRLLELPDQAQLVVLLAAADPLGDSGLVLRAAQALALNSKMVSLATDSGLLEIGSSVRFHHPLVRSAVYGAADDGARRIAHRALASATDPAVDPDRRAWHRSLAAEGPDEDIAEELISSADRAMRRGGVSVAAAFWERAASLTPDVAQRAYRSLAAGEAKYAAGDFDAVQSLLVAADIGPDDKFRNALVQRLRAEIAFTLKRRSDAPPLLLAAAQELETMDQGLAERTYLEALVAAIYAGRFGGTEVIEVIARRMAAAPTEPSSTDHTRTLLRGLGLRLSEGYAAGAPALREALDSFKDHPKQLDWHFVAYNLVSMDLWDDQAWWDVAGGQIELARTNGTLSWLPFALDYLAELNVQAGELAQAEALLAEAERIQPGIRATTLPRVPLLLSAWRGDLQGVEASSNVITADAPARGDGSALTYVDYATAVLHNGLGNYQLAASAAEGARAVQELVVSPWALVELVEAASRSGQRANATVAARGLTKMAEATGSDWARGVAARCAALVSDASRAETLFREALELLSRTRMRSHLARAQLNYGEWLRRANRRIDARDQLRPAFETFASIGAQGFAERARREMLATGEKVRKRNGVTSNNLTPQEEQIAELARQGKTNPEIGAQMFIGARTVEWHLRKIFAKLAISSRRELDEALKHRPT